MKLLSPSVQQDLKAQEVARELIRIQELNKAADKARQNLANAEADFQNTLAQNRKKWADEELEHEQRTKEMLKEVEALELRRANALKPITELQQEAEEKMANAVSFEQSVKEREEYAVDLADRLQDKLDTIGKQEQDIIRETQRLEVQRNGILLQRDQVAASSKQLSQQMKEFEIYKAGVEKELDEKKSALVLWDRSLEARENKLKRESDNLVIIKRQLDDQRITLQAGFDELRRKTNSLSPHQS